CLDGCSALMFLLQGKWSFYRAVLEAHREYRKLRKPGELLPNPAKPEGIYNGWIVPKGLFGK
nr:hypothetical protein [Bacteroidales bacterium]